MSFELAGSCCSETGGLRTNVCFSSGDVFMKTHFLELQVRGKESAMWTSCWADICWRLSNVLPSIHIICMASIWLLLCSLHIFLNALVIDLSIFVIYEVQYDAATYEFNTYYAFVFVFHITGMSLEKLLFQIWESFHLRKSVGCLSVHCMAWMYSSSERFTCVKKASKLIISSNLPSSRNANKDLDFSTTTFSSTPTSSMILVALIGGTRKLYLQCEFFHFLQLLVW